MAEANQHQKLVAFVMEQAALRPVAERIELYRALGEVAGDQKTERELNDLANELEKAEKHSRLVTFHFKEGK